MPGVVRSVDRPMATMEHVLIGGPFHCNPWYGADACVRPCCSKESARLNRLRFFCCLCRIPCGLFVFVERQDALSSKFYCWRPRLWPLS